MTIAVRPATENKPAAGARLVSLDAFRGLTIAAMILVNSPGDPNVVYWPLDHAEWHGWTPTDLIFPFFLFIVGVSMMFSFARRRQSWQSLLRHIVFRSAVIFALGLFLNTYPFFNAHTVRIPGVLQRIAVCYLAGSLIVLATGRRWRAVILAALLAGYWALMRFVPVPGYGTGHLDPSGNLAAYIDRAVFAGHMWRPMWDPEGLLSTLPAIATVLFGSFAGEWLQSARGSGAKVVGLVVAGVVGIALGEALNPLFPINKNLWTSTFAVFTAGFACLLLGICYGLLDATTKIAGASRGWAKPLVAFGVNPIVAYAASSLLTKTLVYSHIMVAGQRVAPYRYIFQTWFAPLASPQNASLLFAVVYVLIWLAILWVLYARRIFVKI